MSAGGSIVSLSIDGRSFSVTADSDATIDMGGWSNTVETNGDGTARVVKARKPWRIEGVVVVINHDKGDLQFLQQEVANGRRAGLDGFINISIELASGETYSGRGTLVDEVQTASQNTTASLNFSGPGALSLQ